MLQLAAPLALAELGWMAMGIVDTIMAGQLGPAAVGAGSLANMIFFPTVIGATGLLLGMDTLVAQAFGSNNHKDTRRTLVNGIWLALAISPLLAGTILALIPVLRAARVNPHVMVLLVPFTKALIWGIPPLLLYTAFRRYLQAVNIVKPVMFALVSANLVNILGNWILMFGHWGAPRLGLAGSGWSTSLSRLYMAAVLLAAILWHERQTGKALFHISWRPDWSRIERLVRLGLPSCGQIMFEGAVFGDRHRAGRAPGRSFAGGPQHRRAGDRYYLHGAVGDQFGRGRSCRAGSGAPRSPRCRRRRLDRALHQRAVHGVGRHVCFGWLRVG